MSVLLGEPRSLERCPRLQEGFAAGGLTVAHRPEVPDPRLHQCGAAGGTSAGQNKDDDLIVPCEELRWLEGHLSERLRLFIEEPPDFLGTAICPGAEDSARRYPFEVRMSVGNSCIPIVSADRLVDNAQSLNVCLRHRPRSIPQAQESA